MTGPEFDLDPLRSLAAELDATRGERLLAAIGDLEEKILSSRNDPGDNDARTSSRFVPASAGVARAPTEAEQRAAKSLFLSNMSHEIRTPLNAITGFAQLLLVNAEGSSTKKRLEWLKIIENSAEHLVGIIDQILELSKIESGELTFDRVPFAPESVFGELVSSMRPRAEEKGLSLNLVIRTPLPPLVESDPARLRQMLANLVTNAIKFTDSGRVTIDVDHEIDDNTCRLRVDVSDTGIGVPRNMHASIFEPFVQADSSVTRQYGGLGLGLAITRHVAQTMRGTIGVESSVGTGSTFSVFLDVDLVRENDGEEGESTSSNGVPRLRERVLLVEDGIANRVIAQSALERAGATVSTASNGEEAIELATSQPFDLILMDLQMPVIDGLEATRVIRSEGIDCPIVMLTAQSTGVTPAECVNAGCDGYLAKPFDLRKLVDLLTELVNETTEATTN